MCKDCPPKQKWEPGYRHIHDGGFKQFKNLPVELQCLVFKHAFPKPKVIDFRFYVLQSYGDQETQIIRKLRGRIRKNTSILPMLQACSNSQKEVYRNFERIEIADLGTHTPYALSHPALLLPSRYHHYEVINDSRKFGSLNHTYMRPDEDILLIDGYALTSLYSYGGSISMSNITNLVLSHLDLHTWKLVSRNRMGTGAEVNLFKDSLLKQISMHCPALSKIHFLLCSDNDNFDCEPSGALDLQILDIDSEFRYQEAVNLKGKLNGLLTLDKIEEVSRMMKSVEPQWEAYMKIKAAEVPQDVDFLQFWKHRKPVLSVMGWLHSDETNEPSYPRIYVPSISAWLPAHADGTIVNKYKGLAQIFDGAPW